MRPSRTAKKTFSIVLSLGEEIEREIAGTARLRLGYNRCDRGRAPQSEVSSPLEDDAWAPRRPPKSAAKVPVMTIYCARSEGCAAILEAEGNDAN
jgi:hypothetical protein